MPIDHSMSAALASMEQHITAAEDLLAVAGGPAAGRDHAAQVYLVAAAQAHALLALVRVATVSI